MAVARTPTAKDQHTQIKGLYPEAHAILADLWPQIEKNPAAGRNVGALGLFRTDVERLLAQALKESGWPSDVWVAWQSVTTPGQSLKQRVAYWVYRPGPPPDDPESPSLVASLLGCNVVFEDGKLLLPGKPVL